MENLVYLNEFGQIENEVLREKLRQIDELIIPILESCSCIEAGNIVKHVQSSISYQASRIAMQKQLKENN